MKLAVAALLAGSAAAFAPEFKGRVSTTVEAYKSVKSYNSVVGAVAPTGKNLLQGVKTSCFLGHRNSS
jgi:hypothetical protein